jgi:hypothetical protein
MRDFSAVRLILVSLAIIISLWAAATFPIFWSQTIIIKIGSRIAAGEPFKQAPLLLIRPQLDYLERQEWPTPESLHNVALIEIRLTELELERGEEITGNLQFTHAQNAIESALCLTPSDGFMWLALFWLRKTRDGMSEKAVPYLRMSYLVGPHEGWIAVRRNRMVTPLLSILPRDLANLAVSEFGDLIASGYIEAAADILTGPGWGNHELLLKSLVNVPEDARRQFADAVYDLGFDVRVPGVEQRGNRPWR